MNKEYVFGANILENLTTGMYQDSKVIFREYIQNACDQIDKAYKMGLLSDQEGQIDINIDDTNRIITIQDNATGISDKDFEKTLSDIANSDKKLGENKGFRGIGRLCGLAYCKELVFSTTAAGEDTISIMHCDALKMRKLITENETGKKYTAEDVLRNIYTFKKGKTKKDEHWFKVELIGINNENTDLLDVKQIREYLSFVAPVPYQNTFIFRQEIYNYAKSKGEKIDEYILRLEGEPIFKKYKTNYKTSKGDDEISKLIFKDIFDSNNNLLGWLWIGISNFKATIHKDCIMRGIRLRKDNIQIGNGDAIQKLFKEDRGNHYFIGEIFALSKDLIPNSQRDYFNENKVRVEFEKALKKYFNTDLYHAYYDASAINSNYSKIESYEKKIAELKENKKQGNFINDEHYQSALNNVNEAKNLAEKAINDLEKRRIKAEQEPDSIMAHIITRIDNTRKKIKTDTKNLNEYEFPDEDLRTHRTDKLSQYNKKERKLISKIFELIMESTDEKTAKLIIEKIEEGL